MRKQEKKPKILNKLLRSYDKKNLFASEKKRAKMR